MWLKSIFSFLEQALVAWKLDNTDVIKTCETKNHMMQQNEEL